VLADLLSRSAASHHRGGGGGGVSETPRARSAHFYAALIHCRRLFYSFACLMRPLRDDEIANGPPSAREKEERGSRFFRASRGQFFMHTCGRKTTHYTRQRRPRRYATRRVAHVTENRRACAHASRQQYARMHRRSHDSSGAPLPRVSARLRPAYLSLTRRGNVLAAASRSALLAAREPLSRQRSRYNALRCFRWHERAMAACRRRPFSENYRPQLPATT